MEENKVEEKVEDKNCCANCPFNKRKIGHCCGVMYHGHYRCHRIIIRIIIGLILISVGICIGKTMERDGLRGFENQRFMNNKYDTQVTPQNSASGSVTVDVLPPNTQTPPVLE